MSLDQQKVENEDAYKHKCENDSDAKPQQTGEYTASLKLHEICIIYFCAVLYRNVSPLYFLWIQKQITIHYYNRWYSQKTDRKWIKGGGLYTWLIFCFPVKIYDKKQDDKKPAGIMEILQRIAPPTGGYSA